jgi:hypothetical protein
LIVVALLVLLGYLDAREAKGRQLGPGRVGRECAYAMECEPSDDSGINSTP